MEESVLTWMKLDTLRSCCRDHSCQQGQVNKAGDERKKMREWLIWPQQEVPSDEKDYFPLLISSTSSADILITVLASCCRNKYSEGGQHTFLYPCWQHRNRQRTVLRVLQEKSDINVEQLVIFISFSLSLVPHLNQILLSYIRKREWRWGQTRRNRYHGTSL